MKKYICKKPIYENATMLAPDGSLLCHTDHKKAKWYVSRSLATIVSQTEDSLSIQLIFEPNGRAEHDGDEYYLAANKNLCVVCGKDKDYARFHIVPSIYRTHLPETLKSHRSHDVVLMCFDCLSTALNEQHKVKVKLAEQYDAPLHEISEYFTLNQYISGLQIQARTIDKQWKKMPEENKTRMRD